MKFNRGLWQLRESISFHKGIKRGKSLFFFSKKRGLLVRVVTYVWTWRRCSLVFYYAREWHSAENGTMEGATVYFVWYTAASSVFCLVLLRHSSGCHYLCTPMAYRSFTCPLVICNSSKTKYFFSLILL